MGNYFQNPKEISETQNKAKVVECTLILFGNFFAVKGCEGCEKMQVVIVNVSCKQTYTLKSFHLFQLLWSVNTAKLWIFLFELRQNLAQYFHLLTASVCSSKKRANKFCTVIR